MPNGPEGCLPDSALMKPEEIYRIASTFVDKGVNKIRITGGEPLVRKEVGEIIEALGELPVELAITTNGMFIDRYPRLFKQAGLNNINISLDSLKADKFKAITLRNVLDRVMNNIEMFVEEGFHIKVNSVVTRKINDDEIMDFVEWSRKMPVHVRFIEFMPFQGNEWENEKVVAYEEILQRIKNRHPIEKLKDHLNDTAKNYRVAGGSGTFAIISSLSEPFCDTCNRMRLLANGKMKNCLFAEEATDLLTPLRNGEPITPLIEECLRQKSYAQAGKKPGNKEQGGRMAAIGG